MNKYRTIEDLKDKIKGKKVVIRIDANVPMHEGKITDDTRLVEALPSIKFLLNEGVERIVILSHFGRPKDKEPEFSLIRIKEHLSKLLQEEVHFSLSLETLPKGKVILAENLRFNKEEERGGENLAKMLSNLGDYYINDAFSCSHRSHSSISVIGKFTNVYAGFLMMKEINGIEGVLLNATGKSLAIVGGSKVSTKIQLLQNLIKKLDYIFIAGGMANTFLHALGKPVGASLCEKDFAKMALNIINSAKEYNCKIILPQDVIVAKKLHKFASCKMVLPEDVLEDDIILDAGSASILELSKILTECKVFLWNGPLGVFEVPPFGISTFFFAREVAKQTKENGLKSIIGGGDTASAILESGFKEEMTFVSTAGGAFLEWLEGKELPGVLACKI
jgi:phosphoglycerate kinase